jgi:hypothetical protein
MTHYEGAPALAISTSETSVLNIGAPGVNVILGFPPPVGPTVPTVINGVLNFTGGASTTGVTVKVRQGVGTGGSQIGNSLLHTLAASASAQVAFEFFDSVGSPTGYTVTLTAAGAAGTLNTYSIDSNQQ